MIVLTSDKIGSVSMWAEAGVVNHYDGLPGLAAASWFEEKPLSLFGGLELHTKWNVSRLHWATCFFFKTSSASSWASGVGQFAWSVQMDWFKVWSVS